MTLPIEHGNSESLKTKEKRFIPHSISAANTYRQCPRLYYNRYVLGYEDIGEASWLTFGSKIDRLLEVLDKSNLETAILGSLEEFSDPFDRLDVEVILSLYQKQFGLSEPLKPLKLNEKEGNQYPLYVPFHGNDVTGFLNMTVSGRIDKVTLIDGEVGVFEGKTTSQAITPSSAYWKKLEMDPQIAAYTWGLSKELGKPINWVWYQVIRRPSQTAHRMFTRTYTRGGQVYAYTLEEYRTRVFSILDENHDDKPLIARKKIHISEERKDLWVTEHAQSYQAIQAHKDLEIDLTLRGISGEYAWPRNQLGCDMYGGCPFWECCTGKTTIEGSGKFKRRIR